MKINNITVKFGRTLKTVKYENVKFSTELSATIFENESNPASIQKITESLQGMAQVLTQKEIEKYFRDL